MWHRRIGPLILAVLMLASFSSPAALAAPERAVYELRVNTVDTQHTIVALQDGNNVRVPKTDLRAAGVRLPAAVESNADSDVSLDTLRSILTFKIDNANLILDLTVVADYLTTGTSVDLYAPSAMHPATPAHSAFMNYSAGIDSTFGPTFSGEFGTHVGAGFFSTTFSSAARNGSTSITNWVADDPAKGHRLTVGDVLTYSGDLGGGVTLAGAGISRDFGLNPNSYRSVLPGIVGSVTTPSTADIYVNGAFYKQITIQPGQFNFHDLPVNMGLNSTQVIITDAFGRQQSLSQNYYQTSALLPAGQTDYSYNVGKIIDMSGYNDNVTSGFATVDRYAVGLNNKLTLGGRLEAAQGFLNGGPEVAIRLSDGMLGLSAAVSRSTLGSGDAALLAYQRASRNSFLNFSLRAQSVAYATLGDTSLTSRPLLDASAQLVLTANNKDNYAIAYSQRDYWQQGGSGELRLSRYHFIGNNAGLEVSAGYVRSGGRGTLDFSTSLQLLRGTNVQTVRVENTGGQSTVSATLQHSTGNQYHSLGYQLGLTDSTGAMSAYGQAQYRTAYGDYFTTLSSAGGRIDAAVNAAGSIVGIGHRFFAAEPLYDSYALVDTNGISGVEVTANGVDVGRTNRHGYLIVPELGSYYDNRIQILPNNLPLNFDVSNSTQDLVPEYRAGNTVHFEVREQHPVFGSLVIEAIDHTLIPAYGLLKVDIGSATAQSDIGENGEFYLANATPGDHKAVILSKYGTCTFTLHVPSSDKQFLRLGTLRCKGTAR